MKHRAGIVIYYKSKKRILLIRRKKWGEELKRSNDNNIYEPIWVNISNIPLMSLLPSQLKNSLLTISED